MIDIIVCFCDKDFNLLDEFLEKKIKKLTFDYRLTLVDDRTDKSLDLSEKLANYNYLIPEKHIGLFEARRYGFNHTNNDFVWFIDIDDELFDFKFNHESDDDIIIYNFKLFNIPENKEVGRKNILRNRTYRVDPSKDSNIGFINQELAPGGNWSRLFNRKTLQKCYDAIPYTENFFVFEDYFLFRSFTYFAHKYRVDTQCIYQWNYKKFYLFKEHLSEFKKMYDIMVNDRAKKSFKKVIDDIEKE